MDILAEPLKNRQATTITEAWQKIHNKCKKAGVAPTTWVLDNEKSVILEDVFAEAEVTFELVAPYTHQANLAERAIRTFKAHFKSGLATTHPNFPMSQ